MGGLYGGGGGGGGASGDSPDAAGGNGSQGIIVVTYTTGGSSNTNPPSISSISAGTPGPNSATITWQTNEAATSRVEYGTTNSYGTLSTLNSNFTLTHSVTITGLITDTTYHFAVISTDPYGNTATSSDQTLTTANDGSGDAPSGTAQESSLLSGYTAVPSWNVAGVNYAVGIPSGTTLQDPLSSGNLVPALVSDGCSYDSGDGLITCSGVNNITISGYDFSLHDGLGLNIENASNIAISGNNFEVGSKLQNPITLQDTVDGATISDNVINGDGLENDQTVGQGLIEANAYGTITIEYNYLQNAYSELMVLGNSPDGNSSYTVQYNLGMNAGLGANEGAHGDWVQITSYSGYDPYTTGATFSFNTFVQSDPSSEAASQGISFNGNDGGVFSSDIMTYNTVIAQSDASVNTFFNADYSWLDGTGNVENNYVDPTGMSDGIDDWVTIVGGTGSYSDNFTISNNIDMNSGATLSN